MSITELTNEELKQMMAENSNLQIVDVRRLEEYLYLGHMPEARLIPLHELPHQFRTLDPELHTVLLCQAGVRSTDAGHFLMAQGFKHVYNLTYGMACWDEPVNRDIEALKELMQSQGDA
jgi:rhodanese-related sulfurtransferase